MRNATQRSDGRWCCTITMPGADGKPKRVYVYGNTKDEVDAKMIGLQYERQNSLYVAKNKATIEAYMREWLPAYNRERIAETTYATYEMYVRKHINPEIGSIRLGDIMPIHLQRLYGLLLKTHAGKTVLKIHVLLNRAFRDAVRNNLIRSNPCDGVTPPRKELIAPGKERFSPTLCSDDDIIRLAKMVQGTIDEVCIALAAHGGLRRGEVMGLRWTDVDFDANAIYVRQTYTRFDRNIIKEPKTFSSRRRVTMPEYAMSVLLRHKPESVKPSDRVVNKYTPQGYSQHWRLLTSKAGLPPTLRFHDLRHYNATLMLLENVPDKVAAKRLGHSTVATLREVYQHVYDGMETDAMSAIAKHTPKN